MLRCEDPAERSRKEARIRYVLRESDAFTHALTHITAPEAEATELQE
jgi:hypothetical protein